MRLRYLPEALADLDTAAASYEYKLPGLGERFLSEVDRTISRLLAFPLSGRPYFRQYRYAPVRVFPYGIIYRIDDDMLAVRAIWQSQQEPNNLQSDLTDE